MHSEFTAAISRSEPVWKWWNVCPARSATTAGIKVRTGIAALIRKAAIRHTLNAAKENAGHHTKVGFRPIGAVMIRIGGRHTTRIDLSAISSTKSLASLNSLRVKRCYGRHIRPFKN